MTTASNFKIETPHAAIIVWNYKDRVGTELMDSDDFKSSGIEKKNLHKVGSTTISTLSCVSIQTSKSKGQAAGSFQLTLAPTRNWISALTTGSWCCILMSNNPISKDNLRHAAADKIKMVGKIESVRVDTSRDDTGTMRTLYHITGVDWGHIFNSSFYIDNQLASDKEPLTFGTAQAVAVRKLMFGENNVPQLFSVTKNLEGLMRIFGQSITGWGDAGVNRMASTVYNFNMPDEMVGFFGFSSTKINDKSVLKLEVGKLTNDDTYKDANEAVGYINPYTLQGSHTIWQILLENSNPALNEMFPEMVWDEDSVKFTLYNRIRPFSYKNFSFSSGSESNAKSYFQYVKKHNIESIKVISINAGTNWRDKYNFLEIRPLSNEFAIFDGYIKQLSQAYDPDAFEREGFRPMIVETKQFPAKTATSSELRNIIDFKEIGNWVKMMREWYFNTHRMLNGTLVMQGTTEYIGVGDNIKFDEGLLNPTPNINSKTYKKQKHASVLAHVESISHNFTVGPDGARAYRTTIQFVRGIVVDKDNVLLSEVALDQDATKINYGASKNTTNTFSTSDNSDPDKQKGV